MYDNLDLVLKASQIPGTDLLKDIPQFLSCISNCGQNRFGEYLTGYLDSLKVSITEDRVKIYDSSLCKYFLGDNFKTLSRSGTRRAIEHISDHLHLPFQYAHVSRIDIAKNLIMRFAESAYYPLLGQSRYYNRLLQNNGLYYSNSLRQLVFYGKVAEQKAKRRPIPDPYRERNVLRIEMRIRKKLQQQLKVPLIDAKLLSNETFYRNLALRWRDEYMAIQKINAKLYNMKPTGSKKVLVENLAMQTILELGQNEVLDSVKYWQRSGQITKKQAHDLRAFIKRLGVTQFGESGNELINELDRKVKEAALCW